MVRGKGQDGLRGPDRRQDRLRDRGRGAHDPAGRIVAPSESARTEHQRAQTGADLRQGVPIEQAATVAEPALPEGLTRDRKGPYDRRVGRNEPPTHVPPSAGGDPITARKKRSTKPR